MTCSKYYASHCVIRYLLHNHACCFACVDHKYDNFIVGLTNDSPDISTPTFYHYTLCGQYPGAVPNGETVSLYCRANLPPFRYVIVQLPLYGHLVACEIEVLVKGTRMSNINLLIFTIQTDRCSTLLFFLHVGEHLAIVLHDLTSLLSYLVKHDDV